MSKNQFSLFKETNFELSYIAQLSNSVVHNVFIE